MRIPKTRLLMLTATLALAMAGTASANLLVNPGFESPLGTSWTYTIVYGTFSYVDRSTFADHTGTYGGYIRIGPGFGPQGHAYLEQIVSGLIPGSSWTVSGWLRFVWPHEEKYHGYIEALGGGAPQITPWATAIYTQHTLTQTADASGQLTVRLHLDKYGYTATDKLCEVYFDDISVETPVPEPAGIVAMLSGLAGVVGMRMRKRG